MFILQAYVIYKKKNSQVFLDFIFYSGKIVLDIWRFIMMKNFSPEIQELIRQRDACPGSKESIAAHAKLLELGVM
ncbi:MAG: hypothetical protein PHY30_00860, partial [Candidatus Pacebacteria bacterium]|nr:hypothetical protein [Candidatus Paceibacterota bacterium]